MSYPSYLVDRSAYHVHILLVHADGYGPACTKPTLGDTPTTGSPGFPLRYGLLALSSQANP